MLSELSPNTPLDDPNNSYPGAEYRERHFLTVSRRKYHTDVLELCKMSQFHWCFRNVRGNHYSLTVYA